MRQGLGLLSNLKSVELVHDEQQRSFQVLSKLYG